MFLEVGCKLPVIQKLKFRSRACVSGLLERRSKLRRVSPVDRRFPTGETRTGVESGPSTGPASWSQRVNGSRGSGVRVS